MLRFGSMLRSMVIVLVFLCGFSSTVCSQELTNIDVAYNGTAGFNLPVWLLESAEVGRKYGFRVKTNLAGGAQGVHALIGGSFQYAQTGLEHVINAVAQGGDVVALGTSEFGFPYKLVGRKGITKPEQLKGGTIGVAAYGGTGILSVRMALAKLGLSERDVKIIVAGNTSQRVISVMTPGGLDATILSPPSLFNAEKAGLPILFDIRQFSEYPNSSLVTTRTRIEKDRVGVRRFVRAWTEAIAFFRRRPQETQAVLRKYVRLEDPYVIKQTYEFYAEKLPRSPKVFERGFTSAIQAMKVYNPQMKSVDFEQVLDMSFVDEMERDGFIHALYQ